MRCRSGNLGARNDHANARFLADRLAAIDGIGIDPTNVKTNIVIFDVSSLGVSTPEFSAALKAQGVIANGINETHMRLVTHSNVSRQQCERAAEILARVAQNTVAQVAI